MKYIYIRIEGGRLEPHIHSPSSLLDRESLLRVVEFTSSPGFSTQTVSWRQNARPGLGGFMDVLAEALPGRALSLIMAIPVPVVETEG
jgi:hypothetical protein